MYCVLLIYALSLDELLDGLAVGGAGGGQQLEEGGLIGGEEDTLLFGPLQRHPVVGGLAAGEAVGNQIRLVAVGLQIHGGLEHTDVALDAAEQHIGLLLRGQQLLPQLGISAEGELFQMLRCAGGLPDGGHGITQTLGILLRQVYTGDMVCTRCGEVHSTGEEIPALGHDYGDWTTVKEADCFHTGLEERKCGRCGETEQRETTAETCPSEAYTDLDRNGWYHEYVDWALKNGVMNGVGGGLFEPNGETTRAMLVMVLYRMAGTPDMAGRESSFTDVSADSWYGAAVIWASENGIVNGVGGGLFDPDASLTREQMAMMLYRFAGYLGSNTEKRADLSAYGDADAVSAFAQDAMAWAVAEGLVNGRSAAELAPKAGATRAELATILFRFAALQNA